MTSLPAETWSSYRIVPPPLPEEPLPPERALPCALPSCATAVTCVSCSSPTPLRCVFLFWNVPAALKLLEIGQEKGEESQTGWQGFESRGPTVVFSFVAMLWLSKWLEWEHTRNGFDAREPVCLKLCSSFFSFFFERGGERQFSEPAASQMCSTEMKWW